MAADLLSDTTGDGPPTCRRTAVHSDHGVHSGLRTQLKRHFYREYNLIEDSHWWFLARRQIFTALLDRNLGVDGSGNRRVLDVGCGTGTSLAYLARYGRTEGVDLDREAVEYCHARGFDHVRQASAENLPFDDETFELVTALDVIEHTDDDSLVLREIARVLRPNGYLLVTVPAFKALWGRQDEISAHRRRYVASQLRERLEGAGFAIKRLTYFNAVLFPAIASIRLVKRLLPPERELKSDFTVPAPGPVNGLLAQIFGAERFALKRLNLPFGVSLMALATKPANAT